MHKYWMFKLLVGFPHFSQVLVGKRGPSHVGGVDVDDVQAFRSVIGNQIHWKLFVESELAFVEQSDDGANTLCLGFFDPSVNYGLLNLAAEFSLDSRSASTGKLPFDRPLEHSLFLRSISCNFSVLLAQKSRIISSLRI